MPFIPPALLHPDSYLSQSTFDVSLPSIDVPDIEIPSLPSGDSVIDFFRRLYQAIVNFVVSAPANFNKFAEENPEGVKVGGIILLVVAALVGLFLVIPFLLPVFSAIGTCLAFVGKAVVIAIGCVIGAIQQLVLWIAAGVLQLVGFTVNGVAAGSIAASVQSVVYGPLTTGLFSVLQSLGVTIGRLATLPMC